MTTNYSAAGGMRAKGTLFFALNKKLNSTSTLLGVGGDSAAHTL